MQVMLSIGAFALFTLTFLVMRMFKSTVDPLGTTGGVGEMDPELIARVQKASTDFRNDTHADGWVPCLSLGGAACDVRRRVTASDQEASLHFPLQQTCLGVSFQRGSAGRLRVVGCRG